METEIHLAATDAITVLGILQTEYNARIKHGDGDVDAIERVMEALGEADRITIS